MLNGRKRRALVIDELPRDGILRFSEISRFVGFASRVTLKRRLKSGEFPPPAQVNGHIRYWSAADIRAYINGRRDWGVTA